MNERQAVTAVRDRRWMASSSTSSASCASGASCLSRVSQRWQAARSWGIEHGHLLITLDEGDHRIVEATMDVLAEECAGGTSIDPGVVDRWLEKRNDVSELTEVTKLGVVADTVEVAAPWSELPGLYDDVVAALKAVPGNVHASAHASAWSTILRSKKLCGASGYTTVSCVTPASVSARS